MAATEGTVCVAQTQNQRGEFLASADDGKQVELGGSAFEEHDYFAESGQHKKEVAREELDLNFSETELRLGPPAAATTKDGENKENLQLGYCGAGKISKVSLDLLQDPAESAYQGKGAAQKPLKTVDHERARAEAFPQQQQIVKGEPDFMKDGRNFSEKSQASGIPAAHEASALLEANAATEQEVLPPIKLPQPQLMQSHEFDQRLHSHQTTMELEQARAAFNTIFAGGNLIYPTPVNAVTGTKRLFMEALGNSSTGGRRSLLLSNNSAEKAAASSLSAAKESEAANLSHQQKLQFPSSVFQAKPGNVSSFSSWKLGLELVGGSFGPFPSPRAHTFVKTDPENVTKPAVSAWASPSKAVPEGFPSGAEMSDANPPIRNSPRDEATVSPTRAPVGWPPVQSFRKNSLPPPHSKSAIEREDKPVLGNLGAVCASPNNSHPLFVKVYMDGLGIGRKVDLKTHNSYDKLSATLEEMFHKFLNATHKAVGQKLAVKDLTHFEGKRLNFLCGSEYVITYEDKDGDLMLMGDVPWEMFEETIKRLRIMKGYEAIGLAPRSPDKMKK